MSKTLKYMNECKEVFDEFQLVMNYFWKIWVNQPDFLWLTLIYLFLNNRGLLQL